MVDTRGRWHLLLEKMVEGMGYISDGGSGQVYYALAVI